MLVDRITRIRTVLVVVNRAEVRIQEDMVVVVMAEVPLVLADPPVPVDRQAVTAPQLHIITGMMIAEVSNPIHMTKSCISQFEDKQRPWPAYAHAPIHTLACVCMPND